jgi:hypothetical protein
MLDWLRGKRPDRTGLREREQQMHERHQTLVLAAMLKYTMEHRPEAPSFTEWGWYFKSVEDMEIAYRHVKEGDQDAMRRTLIEFQQSILKARRQKNLPPGNSL